MDFGKLQGALNHDFTHPMLLMEALTHASIGHRSSFPPDCQRLAWAGEAVVQQMASRVLMEGAGLRLDGESEGTVPAWPRSEDLRVRLECCCNHIAYAASAVKLGLHTAIWLEF